MAMTDKMQFRGRKKKEREHYQPAQNYTCCSWKVLLIKSKDAILAMPGTIPDTENSSQFYRSSTSCSCTFGPTLFANSRWNPLRWYKTKFFLFYCSLWGNSVKIALELFTDLMFCEFKAICRIGGLHSMSSGRSATDAGSNSHLYGRCRWAVSPAIPAGWRLGLVQLRSNTFDVVAFFRSIADIMWLSAYARDPSETEKRQYFSTISHA